MCVRAILLLVDPINCSVRSANKVGAQAPRAPPLATPLQGGAVCNSVEYPAGGTQLQGHFTPGHAYGTVSDAAVGSV